MRCFFQQASLPRKKNSTFSFLLSINSPKQQEQASGIIEGLYVEASRTLKNSSRKAAETLDKAATEKKSGEAEAAGAKAAPRPPPPPPPPSSRPPLAPSAPKQQQQQHQQQHQQQQQQQHQQQQQQQQQRERRRSSHDGDANVAQMLPILLLGPSGIGKTKAARAWASSSAVASASASAGEKEGLPSEGENKSGGGEEEDAAPTVGADPLLRTMTLPDRTRVAVALWDCGGGEGGGGGGEQHETSPEKAVCSSLGGEFFAGARAVILAYDSGSSAGDAVTALKSWLAATEAQLGGGGGDEDGLASPSPSPSPQSPVVVVGLGARKGEKNQGQADEAAARWAAENYLCHFIDLGAAASAATLLALEAHSLSAASSTRGRRSRGGAAAAAADSASDAADVLGSLKCLGVGGGIGRTKKASAPSTAIAAAGAGR